MRLTHTCMFLVSSMIILDVSMCIAFVSTVISKDTFRDVRVLAGVACKVQKGKSFTVNYKLSNNSRVNTGANSKTCFKRSKFHYEMRKLPLKCVELADVVCYARKICMYYAFIRFICMFFVAFTFLHRDST